MANSDDEEINFQQGERLGAAKLNRLASSILRRIVGSPPVQVLATPGGVSISLGPFEAGDRAWIHPAKVKTKPADVTQQWTIDTYEAGWDFSARRENIPAYVIDSDLASTLVVGSKVAVFASRSTYWIITTGGGASTKIYKVVGNDGSGNYTVQEYEYPGGPTIGGAVSGHEMNGSTSVPNGHHVFGSLKSNGKVEFYAPFGC